MGGGCAQPRLGAVAGPDVSQSTRRSPRRRGRLTLGLTVGFRERTRRALSATGIEMLEEDERQRRAGGGAWAGRSEFRQADGRRNRQRASGLRRLEGARPRESGVWEGEPDRREAECESRSLRRTRSVLSRRCRERVEKRCSDSSDGYGRREKRQQRGGGIASDEEGAVGTAAADQLNCTSMLSPGTPRIAAIGHGRRPHALLGLCLPSRRLCLCLSSHRPFVIVSHNRGPARPHSVCLSTSAA